MRTWSKPVLLGGLLIASLAAAEPIDTVRAQLSDGDYSAALATLGALPAARQNSVAAMLLHAEALAGAGERAAAEARLRQLISDHPERPEGYNNLASLLVGQGRLEEARSLLEQALRSNEPYATVYDNLLRINEQIARRSYARALVLKQEKPLQLQALTYTEQGDTQVSGTGGQAEPVVTAAIEAEAAPRAPSTTPDVSLPLENLVYEPPAAAAAPPVAVAVEPALPPPPPAAPPETAASDGAAATVASPAESALSEEAEAALHQALTGWAAAWSAQDVERYLASYSDGYSPGNGVSHARWRKQRRARLTRPEWIRVALEDIELQPAGEGAVLVTCIQRYTASNYRDVSRKQLILRIHSGQWLIHSEQTLEMLS